MKVTLKLEGTKELDKALSRLASDARETIMKEAILAAGEPIRQEAESRAPRRTGRLAGDMVAEVGAKHKPSVRVGIGKLGWYGRFIESGTGQRKTKNSANRGAVSAKPFLKPALEAKKNEALAKFREVLRRGLGLK